MSPLRLSEPNTVTKDISAGTSTRTSVRCLYRVLAQARFKAFTPRCLNAEGLTRLGATVQTGTDSITIDPPDAITPATINTFGDHRVAMSFSLAALGESPVTINEPDCTRKTFPDYFSVFESIAKH